MIYTFFIQDLYTTTEIEEPDGWMSLMSELDRQFDTHGVFFSYAGGGDKAGTVFKLGFACEAKTLFEAEYQKNGTEGFYQFGVNEAANEFVTPTNIFLGDIDFESRGFDEDFFNAEIDQITNLVKIKNRSSLKINLNKGLSLDGNPLGNINFDDSIISLATKEFKQIIASNDGQTLDSVQSDAVTTETFLYGGIGFLSVESEELKKFSNIKTFLKTTETKSTFLIAESKAALEINFDIDIDINFTEDQGSVTTTYLAQLLLNFDKVATGNQGGAITVISIDNDVNIAASPNNGSINLTIDVSKYAIVDPGTKVSADLILTMQTTGTSQFSAVLDVTKFDITVTDKIGVTGTRSQWYQLHDVLNKNLNFITNEYDYLFSELLGGNLQGYDADGCFANMFITNGYRVRQIEDDNKSLEVSFKDFISNLNVFSAIGYGIEELESPVSLGIQELFWIGIASDIAEARIMGVNLIYDLVAGSNIGFFNSEAIYGVYELTEVTFNPAYTTIKFDVSKNTNYYGFFAENNPLENTTYSDVYIVTDTTTEFRDRLRVEKWEHFYVDAQLIDLGVVQDYSEEPFTESIYSEINIGFRKHSNDEEKATTLEEIHTNSSWGVQIIKAKKKLSLISSWIGSTFLFNDSRERIFSVKPTTSHTLDNDLFFCEKAEKEGTYTVSFFTSPDFITIPADAFENIINGSNTFIISNANEPYNDGVYLIDVTKEVVFKIDTNEYLVSVTSVAVEDADDEVFIQSTSFTQKLFKPESNDKLTSSSGITRPTYIMNQRRTLKRFLIRWGKFINSFLAYLVDSATVTIHNLTYKNNGEFISELDTSQLSTDCLMGDLSGASIQEDANINTDSFPAAKFKPNLINCTIKICDDDYDMILAAHKNRLLTRGIAWDGIINGETAYNILFEIPYFRIEFVFDYPDIPPAGSNYLFSIGSHFFVHAEGSTNIQVRFKPDGLGEKVFTFVLSLLNQGSNKLMIESKFLNISSIQVTAFLNDIDVGSFQFSSVNYDYDQSNGIFIASSHLSADIAEYKLFKWKYTSLDENSNEINKLINFDIANGNNIDVNNKGVNAPANTNLVFSALPTYINQDIGDNYGFITIESPNAITKKGWLMNLKRSPVNRIAKLKLLERA